MTEDQLYDAVEIELERYSLADRLATQALLPDALAEFVAANVWDFLIPISKTVQTVANRNYITMPSGYYKVLALWKPNYKTQKTNYIRWAELQAANVSASVKGLLYCQMGDRIHLYPTPTSVETYNFLGAIDGEGLTFGSIPLSYHSVIKRLLICLRIPKSHAAYKETKDERDAAMKDAIAISNDQPDTQEPVELDDTQRRINFMKYGNRQGWPRRTLGSNS